MENEAQNLFVDKLKKDDIRFELVAEGGFELPQKVKKLIDGDDAPLFQRNYQPLEKSLYEKIYAKEFNGLEKIVPFIWTAMPPLNGGIAWRLKVITPYKGGGKIACIRILWFVLATAKAPNAAY